MRRCRINLFWKGSGNERRKRWKRGGSQSNKASNKIFGSFARGFGQGRYTSKAGQVECSKRIRIRIRIQEGSQGKTSPYEETTRKDQNGLVCVVVVLVVVRKLC